MITFFFDHQSIIPMYEQLYQFIKREIETGSLKSKEKMPSKRALANHLKISISTVENAYAKLISEGYLKSIEKSGYYVENVPFPRLQKNKEKTDLRIDEVQEESYEYDFRTNMVDSTLFPYSVWSKLSRSVLADHPSDLLSSKQLHGLKELRNEIAVYLYRFRGINALPEQIIISSGSETIYHQIIQLFGQDYVYATENPGYGKVNQLLTVNHCQVKHIALDYHGLSITNLRRTDANIVHVTPSHQYPTGILMPIKRRIELLEWANEDKNRYIVEDDYDSEFTGGSIPVPALQSLDHQEKVIYINTFSKVISPSLRIGYFVLPKHLIAKYQAMIAFNYCTVSHFEQYILAKFLKEGFFESHLNRLRSSYRKRRDELIYQLVSQGICQKNQIFNSETGLHFVIQINHRLSEEELVERAKSKSIRLYGLNEFIYGSVPKTDPVIIFGYTSIDFSKIKPAISKLKEAWQ